MSWKSCKIKDFAEVITGGTPSTTVKEYWENGNIPWLNSGELNEDIVVKSDNYITKFGLEKSAARLMPKDSILIALTGATTGVVGYLTIEACANQSVTGILPSNRHNSKYLYYYLKSIREKVLSDSYGGAQKHISQGYVKDLEIPLPPLPIQKRITEILDAADALRRKDQELLRKYDELAQAIFIDMFGDPVKNEKGFAKIKLGKCLENIQIGPFGTQLHESDYIKNGIPLINPMHIGDLKIKPNHNYSISEEKYLDLPQYHLKVNDVILGRRGEMGRCAIVTEVQGKCLCGTGSLFLTVNKELLDPLFLVYVLSRKTTKIALENVSAGTTMANLNKNIISDFEIILPGIEKQKDFVNAIKMSELSIEATNQLVNKSKHIFDSLLQQAFKGELVK
jgi:type I restriction enzyme S subunit